jgi:hypothetical protein
MGRRVTRTTANEWRPGMTETDGRDDQAHERDAERPSYRVRPQDDGGTWRGPTYTAWMTRILRGARPPRASTGIPSDQ